MAKIHTLTDHCIDQGIDAATLARYTDLQRRALAVQTGTGHVTLADWAAVLHAVRQDELERATAPDDVWTDTVGQLTLR